MGQCRYCGVKTGWFKGNECEDCAEKYEIHFNDEVEVVSGFYEGFRGVARDIEDRYNRGGDGIDVWYTMLIIEGEKDTIQTRLSRCRKIIKEDT